MPLSPLEVVKVLPKSNCGECGYPSCLAFAVAFVEGRVSGKSCPYLPQELAEKDLQKGSIDQAVYILEEVKKEVETLNFAELYEGLEVGYQDGVLLIPYLDSEVILDKRSARRVDGVELDPRDQILLYNYVRFKGRGPLSGRFVGLESFPNSVSKVVTLRRYAEEPLRRAFDSEERAMVEAVEGFRYRRLEEGDLGFELKVLPKVPIRVVFWKGDPEEGLSSELKLLFDERAMVFLDLESLVFCAERLAERWLELAGLRGS